MSDRFLLLANGGVTLAMVGIMWTVQLTVYPQFRSVDHRAIGAYASSHASRIVAVLAPFAPLEVILGAVLFIRPAEAVGRGLPFVAGCLLVAGWVATAAWYAPLHGRLQAAGPGGADALVERLIITNWIRTGLWTVRGGLALAMLWIFMGR